MSTLNFNVRGEVGDDTPVLITDNPPGGTATTGRFEPGRFIVSCDPGISGGAWLFYANRLKSFRVILPPGDGEWEAGQPPCIPPEYEGDVEKVALIYEAAAVSLPPFTLDGRYPRLADGTELNVNSKTLFRGYARFLAGGRERQLLDSACEQLQVLKFNFARFWLLADTTYLADPALQYRLDPRIQYAFYERIPDFVRYLAGYGLYPEAVIFTRAQTLMPSANEQVAHLYDCQKALAPFPGLVSKVNEHDQHDNGIAPETIRAPKFAGALYLLSNGSNGLDAAPVEPVGEVAEYHIAGGEWQRKSGHNAWELGNTYNRAMWTSESQRAPDNDGDPNHFEDAAKGMGAMVMGGCFHDVAGKNADPMDAQVFALAAAHSRGMFDGGIAQRRGAYIHRTDLEGPGIIRAYQMGSYVWTVRE